MGGPFCVVREFCYAGPQKCLDSPDLFQAYRRRHRFLRHGTPFHGVPQLQSLMSGTPCRNPEVILGPTVKSDPRGRVALLKGYRQVII